LIRWVACEATLPEASKLNDPKPNLRLRPALPIDGHRQLQLDRAQLKAQILALTGALSRLQLLA
jgi:hypothetical protein